MEIKTFHGGVHPAEHKELSKESPLIRKNYPGPIPSLVLVDANGNKIASGSMDGLVRKVEELASAEKEKEATAESE